MNKSSKISNFLSRIGIGEKPKGVPVVITTYSQPHVLQQRMLEQGLTHDQTVTADLSQVRVETAYGKIVLYFCPMDKISVKKVLREGDGKQLPQEATVYNLNFPENMGPGLYNLKNVKLHSNGTMQVKATKKTKWEQIY